ncbi:MAG: DUF4292 domain-containing protein [Prevotella sp.]|nr:DUF4292 domain-containing protein [Prevotella sp.]
MKTSKIILTGIAALMLAACGTQKAAVTPKPAAGTDKAAGTTATDNTQRQKLGFVQRVSDQALYQRNLVSNLTFTLSDGHKDITVPGILHMRKDEVIRLQLLIPIIRSEVGRIEFAKDYVLFIDRIHKQYVKASYNDVAFLRDNGINFYSLQALFWNQLFIPGQQRVSESSLSKFDVDLARLANTANATTAVTLKDGKMTYRWMAQTLSGLISEARAQYVSPNHGTSTLTWKYSGFMNFGSKKFPTHHELTIETEATKQKKTLKANFELDGFSDSADWDTMTTPSDKYKQVSVEEILGKLMNF